MSALQETDRLLFAESWLFCIVMTEYKRTGDNRKEESICLQVPAKNFVIY